MTKDVGGPQPAAAPTLTDWSREMALLYESHAANQFVLFGNIADEFHAGGLLVGVEDYVIQTLLPKFDVVLQYDLGNGLRPVKGSKIFAEWPGSELSSEGRRSPRGAMETITHYLRFVTNLGQMGHKVPQVAVLLQSAHLIAPALPNALSYDLNALALLIRDWSRDLTFRKYPIATFLFVDNLNDLHPLLASNPDAAPIQVPLPSPQVLSQALQLMQATASTALSEFRDRLPELGAQLTGATLKSVRRLLLRREKEGAPVRSEDVSTLKKLLVERECGGLIEFVESNRTLSDLEGQPELKQWLRDDMELWRKGDTKALPMGYLFCGPVGTGKTYAVECLAGEAGVPVVKMKNFRDRWVGSTEGNLEKIFRLLRALGRCFVFIDEADQSLGKRDAGTNDAGLSGRIYSMFAKEMSDRANRGRIIWILASSRPDLIEVDLKRPGRVDVKIPLLPTATPEESFRLVRALLRRLDLTLPDDAFPVLEALLPVRLTPGAAEALAVNVYRRTSTTGRPLIEVLATVLGDYQPPVPADVMQFQIDLAVRESTDIAFVPEAFRQTKDVRSVTGVAQNFS